MLATLDHGGSAGPVTPKYSSTDSSLKSFRRPTFTNLGSCENALFPSEPQMRPSIAANSSSVTRPNRSRSCCGLTRPSMPGSLQQEHFTVYCSRFRLLPISPASGARGGATTSPSLGSPNSVDGFNRQADTYGRVARREVPFLRPASSRAPRDRKSSSGTSKELRALKRQPKKYMLLPARSCKQQRSARPRLTTLVTACAKPAGTGCRLVVRELGCPTLPSSIGCESGMNVVPCCKTNSGGIAHVKRPSSRHGREVVSFGRATARPRTYQADRARSSRRDPRHRSLPSAHCGSSGRPR